jgi:hypothetical protein
MVRGSVSGFSRGSNMEITNLKNRFIRKEEPKRTVLRVIPHSSVLNSTSRKIQSAIYELLSVKPSKFPWHHKQGLFILIKPTPDFWWITRLYAKEEVKRIEYYVCLPTEFVDAFKTKFSNHEQWRRCTLEDVKIKKRIRVNGRKYRFKLIIPKSKKPKSKKLEYFEFPAEENTDLYSLKYKRHDVFSLNFDYTEQKKPARDIMAITNELKDGEAVSIYIRTESVDRMKWKKLSDYAWKIWDKGDVPYRAGLDPIRLFHDLFKFVTFILQEAKSLAEDILHGLQKAVMIKSEERPKKKEQQKPKNPDREELLVNGDIPLSKKKRNLPAFKTSIRYTVTSEDEVCRGMLGRSVSNAYEELSGDNKLQSVKINFRAKKALDELRNWKIDEIDPNIMSVDEVGKLEQLPVSDLQQEFSETLESNQKIEVDIPKVFLDDSGIFVGTTTDRNQINNIHISKKRPDTMMTTRAFVGSPRQGKDQALINLIVESKRKHGIGAVIPDWIDERNLDKDGHQRGLSDAIRDSLPLEDVIDIDCSDYDWPIYLGLHNVMKAFSNARIAADDVSKIITNFLMDDDMNLHTTREYLRDAAKVCGGDWLDIKRLFTDEDFRKEKIDEMETTNIGDADLWKIYHEDMTDAQRSSIFTPVNVRLGEILNDEVLAPILCQRPNPEADIQQWITEGKVVILRMKINSMSAKTLVHFIVMMVYLIKRQLDGNGAPTWLVLNEPHQIETPSLTKFLSKILVEGPKFKLAPVLAFHHLGKGHLSHELIDNLSSANISWHLFYNSNIKTYEKLQAYIEPTFTPDTAMKMTPQYHFIAAGWRDTDGMVQPPFMCKAPDRVKDRWGVQDNSFLTKRHSRVYGRPIDEVLADFRERTRRKRKANKTVPETVDSTDPNMPEEKSKKTPKHVYYKK